MKLSDFYYELPPELIAQTPAEPRDHSRLMVIGRAFGGIEHTRFYNLCQHLRKGDLLVLNNSRVLPARIFGEKAGTGARVQFLLLEQRGPLLWEVMVKPGRRLPVGARVDFSGLLQAEILEVLEGGNRLVRFDCEGSFFDVLERIGQMPLPHYITTELTDQERYQTVYSKEPGSSAAPTAGLHFTPELLEQIQAMGVGIAYVTLHVGLGTFRPVKVSDITHHKMHSEHYCLPPETARAIADTKARGGRVIAVGTTSLRTLESVAAKGGIKADEGYTDIFIYPGYSFQAIDGLLTNFHLPESTLIMLVCAFLGHEQTMRAYRTAIEERYRFFSFGDAMLIV